MIKSYLFVENVISSAIILAPLCSQVSVTTDIDGEHDNLIDSPSNILTDLNDLVIVKLTTKLSHHCYTLV